MDVTKDALQMNFSYINKITSFTNIMNKVGNHKSSKFEQNEPERLWPLLLWIKCNKNNKFKFTQISVKSQKYVIKRITCCLYGALGWSEAHGPWSSQLSKSKVGTGRSG